MDCNNELISVVIPAFNRADTIQKCIESVLAQTYRNIEVIVVDDGSSDNTPDLVDLIEDSRVCKCIRLQSNNGACYARNKGAEAAKGAYIAFQDSDDIWKPDKLEKQLSYLKQKHADMVFCGMKRVNQFKNKSWYFPIYTIDESKNMKRQILAENCVSTQCILIRKEAFQKVLFDPTIRKFQDWDFSIRAAEKIKMVYFPEELVLAPVQENSLSRNVSRIESLNVLYEKYREDILNDSYLNAVFLKKMADDYFYRQDYKNACGIYKQSLKSKFNIKVFVKMCICLVKK